MVFTRCVYDIGAFRVPYRMIVWFWFPCNIDHDAQPMICRVILGMMDIVGGGGITRLEGTRGTEGVALFGVVLFVYFVRLFVCLLVLVSSCFDFCFVWSYSFIHITRPTEGRRSPER